MRVSQFVGMSVFWKAFFGGSVGKIVVSVFLAVCFFFGFGPDLWVRAMFTDSFPYVEPWLVRTVFLILAAFTAAVLAWSLLALRSKKPPNRKDDTQATQDKPAAPADQYFRNTTVNAGAGSTVIMQNIQVLANTFVSGGTAGADTEMKIFESGSLSVDYVAIEFLPEFLNRGKRGFVKSVGVDAVTDHGGGLYTIEWDKPYHKETITYRVEIEPPMHYEVDLHESALYLSIKGGEPKKISVQVRGTPKVFYVSSN